MSNEEYVRSVWGDAHISDNYGKTVVVANWSIIGEAEHGGEGSEEQAWSAAAEFTRNRMEEVRQLREEIAWVGVVQSIFYSTPERDACRKRILSRLESELARLTAGIKPEAL